MAIHFFMKIIFIHWLFKYLVYVIVMLLITQCGDFLKAISSIVIFRELAAFTCAKLQQFDNNNMLSIFDGTLLVILGY